MLYGTSLTGVFPAVPTPYDASHIDEDSFKKHVAWLFTQGVDGVVPCGTTGESVALSTRESERLIEICREICPSGKLVIPGVGTPSLDQTTRLALQAQDLKADAILVITPYYVKADMEGIFQYYRSLHDALAIPLILYNNPSRTGVCLDDDIIRRLAMLPRVIGIKEASNDLLRPLRLSEELSDFAVLSGEDALFLPFLTQGARGIISVGANVIPSVYVALYQAFKSGDLARCMELNRVMAPLVRLLFRTPSPGPVKYALSRLGFGSPQMRIPMTLLCEAHKQDLDQALKVISDALPHPH